MTTTDITVHYERKFSDGNYGSEGLAISLTISADPNQFTDEFEQFAEMALAARQAVLTQLSKSAAYSVSREAARELNPPPPRQPVPAGELPTDEPEDLPY